MNSVTHGLRLRTGAVWVVVGMLAACDPQAAYDAEVDKQMEQINADAAVMMDDIERKVATDAVKQYEIVKSSGGSAMDRCVQAGMVTAAFLQANDAGMYEAWKKVERADCRAAGMP